MQHTEIQRKPETLNFKTVMARIVAAEPVTLTREVLARCGFIYSHEDQIHANGLCRIKEFDGWFVLNGCNVQYLHEVQTLYYLRTKQELIYDSRT